MNIVFWGGCVNRQPNIRAEMHYHVAVKRLVEAEAGIAPKTWLRFYSSYHELHQETLAMLQREESYDHMVIFLRPFPLIALTKPLIRYTDKKKQTRLALHPRFSKEKYYDNMIKEYKVAAQSVGRNGVLHKMFQRLNDFAGNQLGLPQWTKNEVIKMMGDLHYAAQQRKTKLLLVGPILYPANQRINQICIDLNRQVEIFSSLHKIPHVDIARSLDETGNRFLENDGKHLTESAHLFMAEQISKFVNESVTISTPVLNLQ